MPESAQEIYQRVVDAVGENGRLPMSPYGDWDIFPWEVADGRIVPKVLQPPSAEPTRFGEDSAKPCGTCAGVPTERVVWEDDEWILTHAGAPSGLPLVLQLHTREHLDFGSFTDELAAAYGRISNRLVRIIENLPNIARVHVYRVGDGGSHVHIWFLARTAGLTNVLGSAAQDWDDMLPAVPEEIWRADLREVGSKLANWGGIARN